MNRATQGCVTEAGPSKADPATVGPRATLQNASACRAGPSVRREDNDHPFGVKRRFDHLGLGRGYLGKRPIDHLGLQRRFDYLGIERRLDHLGQRRCLDRLVVVVSGHHLGQRLRRAVQRRRHHLGKRRGPGCAVDHLEAAGRFDALVDESVIRGREGSACGNAEPRPCKAEARHRRKFALGVGPQRQ